MKSASLKRLFLIFAISVFTLSCTLPFYIGPAEPEEKIVYVEVTVTPEEPTEIPEEDVEGEEPAVTPTVSVNLDGSWTIWYGVDEDELALNFLQQGYQLSANAATGGDDSMLFTGNINHNGDKVEGTWESTDGTNGNFTMNLSGDLYSFTGNMGGGVAFCGVRGSTEKPATCLK